MENTTLDTAPTESFLYRCCFCKAERVSYWTPNPMFTLAKWQDKIACNKCADYHTERLGLTRKIDRICRSLVQAHQVGGKELASIVQVSDGKLTELTRRLARTACDHLNIQTVWERDFVLQLLDKPELACKIITMYLQLIRNSVPKQTDLSYRQPTND
jgi:hypothetical protein